VSGSFLGACVSLPPAVVEACSELLVKLKEVNATRGPRPVGERLWTTLANLILPLRPYDLTPTPHALLPITLSSLPAVDSVAVG
jgi:hypothetical protein